VKLVDRRGLHERLGGGPEPRPNSAYFMFAAMALDLSLLDESPIYGLSVPQHLLRRLNGSNTRMAERYRDRRLFLVGDAAHVHGQGGSGLNLGMQDAANLGWKLAAEIHGHAPAGLLDTYESERRPAGRRVVMYAQAVTALMAPGDDVTALRELFTELLGHLDTVQHLADLTAGTDVHYDMGDAHPLVGHFAPDLVLETPTGTVRLAELTRAGRPLLLDLTEDGTLVGWSDRVDVVAARPQAGAPSAVLLRPDTYVAWASDSPAPDVAELDAAIGRWFGAVSASAGRRTAG
jgi:hypothetical protein